MTESITIQLDPPGFSEWADVLDLLHAAFAYMNDRIDPPSSLYRLDVDSLEAKGTDEHLVIARRERRIVGCAFGRPLADALYVGKVAVDAHCRGLGVASRMIATLESKARELNKAALELETRIELIENHDCFARLGFVKTAENAHAGYSRSTSITMQKKLS